MPDIKVTVRVEIDGRPVPGFDPYVRRLSVAEYATINDEVAELLGYTTRNGTDHMGEVQVFADIPSVLTQYRFNGTADGDGTPGIPINPGGLILIVDGDLDAGGATNVETKGAAATLKGVVAGT